MKKIFIIGCGMGNENLLTFKAKNTLINCHEVYAFDRIAELFLHLRQDIKKCTYSNLLGFVENSSARDIGVLVSGDVGFFSMAKSILKLIGEKYEVELICGVSSLQYFCSKLKISYEKVNVVSLHGRNNSILGSIAYNKYTFVLTGGNNNASDVLKELVDLNIDDVMVYSGEMLSMENERILSGSIKEMTKYSFDNSYNFV